MWNGISLPARAVTNSLTAYTLLKSTPSLHRMALPSSYMATTEAYVYYGAVVEDGKEARTRLRGSSQTAPE